MRGMLALIALMGLSACAADIVRLEHADAVSSQATATVKAANSYVADIQTRRREANIAMVASDPSCSWGDYVTTDTDWTPPLGFCEVTGVPAARLLRISLRPISEEALKSLTVAVAGIATYQAALADILGQNKVDAKAGITDAIEKLTTASADISRIAGTKLVDLGPLTGNSAKAVIDLISTLVALQQTNLRVDEVRTVVAGFGQTMIYSDLKTGLSNLTRLQATNSTARQRFALESAYARDLSKLDFSARRERVREIAAAADEDLSLRNTRLEAMSKVVDELTKTDKSLHDALAGKFSAEERRRIARDNRTQILKLLSDVAALYPAI